MAGEAGQPTDTVLRPESSDEVADCIRQALADETSLEVLGAGTKRALGRPVEAPCTLDLSGLAGIVTYEPEELVLTARVGTPLAEIEAAIGAQGQMLAFEPADYGPLFGAPPGQATIGGVIAAACAGPRRIKSGGARDHILGIEAVSGRAEAFKAGGRVVKNVTGYDIPKLLTGSFGTLAVMTTVTLKLAPKPECETTLILSDLDDAAAIRVLTSALGGAFDVSGAMHLPADIGEAGSATTALRLEGFAVSVADRVNALRGLLTSLGEASILEGDASRAIWKKVQDVAAFHPSASEVLWRVSVPPADGARVGARLRQSVGDARLFFDWGGSLIWLGLSSSDPKPDLVRSCIPSGAGAATLFRAPAEVRAHATVFPPLDAPLQALTARVKDQFDPKRVFNPGRLYKGV